MDFALQLGSRMCCCCEPNNCASRYNMSSSPAIVIDNLPQKKHQNHPNNMFTQLEYWRRSRNSCILLRTFAQHVTDWQDTEYNLGLWKTTDHSSSTPDSGRDTLNGRRIIRFGDPSTATTCENLTRVWLYHWHRTACRLSSSTLLARCGAPPL